jgi:mannose-1-phosphate guanylyltransferase
MNASHHRWAVVLAGSMSERQWGIVPKQYNSLKGAGPPIHDAIRRAQNIVGHERVCIVVEHDHHQYWSPLASIVPPSNLLMQPSNCGTAIAILLAVLAVADRDPFAHVLAMNRTLDQLSSSALELVFVGVEAKHPASDLGYILPGARLRQGLSRVRQFIERPTTTLARQLCQHGALWSTSLFGSWAFSVLALLREHLPAIVDIMRTTLAQADSPPQRMRALAALYERLPTVDFARTISQRSRSMMHVIHASGCGWTNPGSIKPRLI